MSFQERNEQPDITIRNITETEIEFDLKNVSTSYANALRRVIIAEVPTVAIEKIDFSQNSSPLPDEMIAHRLGLIPLSCERSDHLVTPDQCDCGGTGCPRCQVTFYCNVRTGDEPYTVTTDDLMQFDDFRRFSVDGSYGDCIRESKSILPAQIYDQPNGNPTPIIITKLGAHQQLTFAAYAVKGIGRTHAKWSSVCACAYRHIPRIRLDQPALKSIPGSEKKIQLVQTCPSKVFSYNANEDTIEIENESACTFCRACTKFLDDQFNGLDAIDISNEPDVFSFLVESNGMLRPETIVTKAFEVLRDKLDRFLQEVKHASVAE